MAFDLPEGRYELSPDSLQLRAEIEGRWITLANLTGLGQWDQQKFMGFRLEDECRPFSSYRLYFTHSLSGYVGFSEIHLYGSGEGQAILFDYNLRIGEGPASLGAPLPVASVSAAEGYLNPGETESSYQAAYLFDHNLTTLWHSPAPPGSYEYVEVGFEQAVKVGGLAFLIREDRADQGPTGFDVYKTDEAGRQVLLGFYRSGKPWEKGEFHRLALPNQTKVKWMRIEFAKSASGYVSLLEMRVLAP